MKEFRDKILQVHYERIADYFKCGYGVWYHKEGDTIVFHDGDSRERGPHIATFASSNMQQEKTKIAMIWTELTEEPLTLKPLFNKEYRKYDKEGEFYGTVGK